MYAYDKLMHFYEAFMHSFDAIGIRYRYLMSYLITGIGKKRGTIVQGLTFRQTYVEFCP
jgi:hypothetical protein